MAYRGGTNHPKAIGDRTTAAVLNRLVQTYECVLLPFGENVRYDLLVDDGGKFLRVQCKTGRLRNGAVVFPTCSQTYHHPNSERWEYRTHNYRGQADLFGVYCPETDSVYLVPVDAVGTTDGTLRVDPPRNGQQRRVRWARDFLVPGTSHPTRHPRKPSQPSTLFERAAEWRPGAHADTLMN